MEEITKILNDYPLLKIVVIVAIIVVVLKIVLEVLKVAKLVNLEDKSLFDALHSILLKKSYLVRKAKKAIKHGNLYDAGKIFEEIGDYKRALNAYEEGEQYNEMGELYEKLNREAQAIEVYKKSGNLDKLIQMYLKRKNIEAAGVILEDNNRFQEAEEQLSHSTPPPR